MTEANSLLRAFADSGCEEAFRQLVDRYIDLVYSTAMRVVAGDRHLAEDIAQTVFADLARSARTLSREILPGGWLHRHTCFVAMKALRTQRRRQARERQAMEMNALHAGSETDLSHVAPFLDEAIEQLDPDDRKAILLRFFDQCDFRTVGRTLGSSEDAARMRVNRALEKLELLLKSRGVTFPAAALGTALGAQAVVAAPAGLAAAVSAGALGAAGGSASIAIHFMSMTKLQTAALTAIIVAGIATPILVQQQRQSAALKRERAPLENQLRELQPLRQENQRLSDALSSVAEQPGADETARRELLRLRGEVGRARLESTELSNMKAAMTQQATQATEALAGMSGLMEEGMARAMAFQSNQAFQRISAMKEALRLSPEQEAALRETAVVSLEESARLARAEWAREISPEQRAAAMREDAAAREQQLQGMLSPDQRIAYEQFQRDEQAQSARRSAAHSAEQIQQSLNLSAQQAEQVQSALYELNLKDTAIAGRNRADTLDTPDLIVRDQTARLEAQLQALSGVLTPEQLAQYREEQVKEISRAAALIRFVQTFSAPTNR